MRGKVAIGVVGTAWMLCGVAAAQQPPPSALALTNRAQDLYQRGRARFLVGDYAAALEAFESSLEAFESPNARLYLGRTYHRLGRLPEAWATLDRTARDAAARSLNEPRYAPTAAAAREEAEALAPHIGRLSLEVSPAPAALTLTINAHPVARAALGVAIPVDPGDVVVMARAPGFAPALQIVSVSAGAHATVRLSLVAAASASDEAGPPPAPEASVGPGLSLTPPGPRSLPPLSDAAARRSGAWRGAGTVALVFGALSLAGAGVLYYFAREDYLALGARTQPSPGDDSRIDRGMALQYGAFGLGGLSVALLASGSVMRWVLGRPRSEGPPAFSVEPTARGLAVSGTF